MSQYGPPPPGPDDGPEQPDEQAGQQPDRDAGQPSDAPTYNPYPDNWSAPPTGNPAFTAAPPPQPSSANPYGQPAPYGVVPAPGGPENPYAGAVAGKPTFGFGGYAGWFTRVGASLIDGLITTATLIPLFLAVVVLAQDTTTTTNPDGTTSSSYTGDIALPLILMIISGLLYIGVFVWNVCIRQGRTGATVGKSVLAIRLVNSDLQPIGAGWAFLRSLLHVVDGFCYIGYLWPIWDPQKQTFADKIMSTYVIQATTPQERPFI